MENKTLLLIFTAAITAYCAKKQQRNPWIWLGLSLYIGIYALWLLAMIPFLKRILLRLVAKKLGMTIRTRKKEPNPSEQTEASVTLSVDPSFSLKTTPEAMQKLWYFLDPEQQTIGPMSFQAFYKK